MRDSAKHQDAPHAKPTSCPNRGRRQPSTFLETILPCLFLVLSPHHPPSFAIFLLPSYTHGIRTAAFPPANLDRAKWRIYFIFPFAIQAYTSGSLIIFFPWWFFFFCFRLPVLASPSQAAETFQIPKEQRTLQINGRNTLANASNALSSVLNSLQFYQAAGRS